MKKMTQTLSNLCLLPFSLTYLQATKPTHTTIDSGKGNDFQTFNPIVVKETCISTTNVHHRDVDEAMLSLNEKKTYDQTMGKTDDDDELGAYLYKYFPYFQRKKVNCSDHLLSLSQSNDETNDHFKTLRDGIPYEPLVSTKSQIMCKDTTLTDVNGSDKIKFNPLTRFEGKSDTAAVTNSLKVSLDLKPATLKTPAEVLTEKEGYCKFIMRLSSMLETPLGPFKSIYWSTGGECIVINPILYPNEAAGVFGSKGIKSLYRQLLYYGFKREGTSTETRVKYCQPKFNRDRPNEWTEIRKQSSSSLKRTPHPLEATQVISSCCNESSSL